MGQHGRNRTGSDATRGNRAFETERHDVPVGEDERVEGFAPAFAGPWDPQGRPPPGIVGAVGPMPIAGAPDTTPREGFDGADRRRQSVPVSEDRRHNPYEYGATLV
ncbi:MAG: hypothetical protein Q8P18_25365 [Pseudomonadota bacterium]|nr:hypothetical protein [Pseudomonadota bacterium]